MSKSRNWCFTAHNPEHTSGVTLFQSLNGEDTIVFGQFQEETAPTTGTRHFQGMLLFSHPVGASRVRSMISTVTGTHVHTEIIKDVPAMVKYTCKEESRASGPWSWGVRPGPPLNLGGASGGGAGRGQGARTDLISFRDAIIAGKSEPDLWMEYPSEMFRYPLMPARIRATFAPKRDWVPEVHVYFGHAGTGKSRRAHELAPGAYRKVSGMWWDLYQGEPDVIMDDFYGVGHMDYTEFLKFTDRYDYTAQIKGGMIRVNPRRIYITSNAHPEQWYCADKNFNSSAFFRRFTSIIRFNPDGSTTDLSEIVLE